MTPLGLWLDGGPARSLALLPELPELGISVAALMVETSRAAWNPTWTVDDVAHACKVARDHDLEVVLTVWPSPRRAWIDAAFAWLMRAVPSGVAALEVDIEGLWRPNRLRYWERETLEQDFQSLAQASALLVLRLREFASTHDLRLEVTTHPGHMEMSPSALVVPHMDVMVAQAYSIRHRPDALPGVFVKWGDRKMGPGHHQHWTAARARTAPGVGSDVDLSLGLPLWGQSWPDHDPAEALGLAYQAALEEVPREIRFWSAQNLRKNDYARRWLKSLNG